MEIELSMNPDLYAADDTTEGMIRTGVINSEVFSGEPQVRDYSEGNRRFYSFVVEDFASDSEKLAQLEAFLEQAAFMVNPFRIDFPVARTYAGFCYPKGNAVNKFFDLPGVGFAEADLNVMVDDVFSPAADWSFHAAANIVPNAIASLEEAVTPASRGHAAFGTSTIARRTGLAAWGLGAILVDPTGTQGNVGVVSGGAFGSAYKIPVEVSTGYTAVFYVRGVGDFRIKIEDFDSSDVAGGSQTSTTSAGSASAWTPIQVNITTAADADYVKITCERTTSSTNDFLVDCIGLLPQDYARWHYPGCAPAVIEFGSAPADDAWVRVSGAATSLRPRVRFNEAKLRWSLRADGIAAADVMQLIEVFG